MKRILITGGTGFIGSNIVNKIAGSGDELRLLVEPRRIEAAEEIGRRTAGNISIFEGDVRDFEAVKKALKGCDTVVHLAAVLKDSGHKELIRGVNLGGTENLLRGSSEAAVRRFVFVSSLSVHRYRDISSGTEGFPADAVSPEYAATKAECEKIVMEESARSGMEWVIIRPGLVPFGEGDYLFTGRILSLINAGVIPLVDGGRHLLCTSYIGNLVHGIELAIRSAAKDSAFIITDQTVTTWRAFLDSMARGLGVRGFRISLPAKVLAPFCGISEKLIGKIAEPPVTRYRLDLLGHDLYFHAGAAAELLNYKPVYTIEEGIKRTVRWYKGGKTSKHNDTDQGC
ncbi:MAG: NAD-dependent epimerase/dehydratase family protein [Deltaproteobacteria bacterium]|nr:NAD-dependent epimerase/dehydratase family protein [Deltaproteobacteria bacterium]